MSEAAPITRRSWRYSMRLSVRFGLVLAVLLPALCAVTAAGLHGLHTGRQGAHSLYEDHLRGTLKVATLQSALQDTQRASLELLLADDPAQRRRLSTEVVTERIPAVQAALGPVAALCADDPKQLAALQVINASWAEFEAVLADQLPTASTPAAHVRVEEEINTEFTAAVTAAKSITAQEAAEADAGYQAAIRDLDLSIELMLIAGVVGLLLSIATVIWLIRSVLPRTLSYSAFATTLGEGDYSSRLHPEGSDELAQLGRVLDELAERRHADDTYDTNQLELIAALQVTDSEQEADELIKWHLERSIANSLVTVLIRNNSADRLHAVTTLNTPPDTDTDAALDTTRDTALSAVPALAASLASAKPRSCQAIRMNRAHHGTPNSPGPMSCAVCSGCPALTSCTALIVGAEVIGSVLTVHEQPLSPVEQRSIRDTVTQAAPVIGNLRNLAVAELRATTDSLTGLPNRRALHHTIRRMVAQTSRTLSPLAALMCDLDHFKQINDHYGHGRGDDVLAAVGTALAASIRASDFAGRYGGEEFLILLPDTDTLGALAVAEKIRAAISAIHLPTIERAITISIGLAIMPEHALDAETLERAADRALYTAKNNGRNRVELFDHQPHNTQPRTPHRAITTPV